jgi:TonB family protein
MYFDFEDYRPDTPSLTAPMTRREAVLLALLLHAVLVIVYLVTPAEWFRPAAVVPVTPVSDKQMVYTRVEPLRELPRLAKPEAPPSDLDRRSSTLIKPPDAKNTEAFSKGNTPDKVEGAPPAEKMRGQESPNPNAAAPVDTPQKPQLTPTDSGLLDPAPKPVGGSLGQSLKNLNQYIKDQNFENKQGGNTDTDAAIQFDSKGVDFGPWLRRFEARVRRNWIPLIPQAAMAFHGRVTITFYVHRNGSLTELEIVKVSGIDSFDSAAFNGLRLSNPVDPLPAAYPDDKALFTVTFLYNERIR